MVTIRINESSKQAKAIIEMLRTFSFVEIKEEKKVEKRYNKQTEKAIEEARAGIGIIKAKNAKELLKKIYE